MGKEILFAGTADAEHVEMYLKAIWHITEMGERCRIRSMAGMLHIREPSVIEMLKKLRDGDLVVYNKNQISLTDSGQKIGSAMMRNSRLLEVMMSDALKIDVDGEAACGIEHHMNRQFADALCAMLDHPRKCPHGHDIHRGPCCA